jgi:ABC-type uncharacterized transport system auxiliary subunit
MSKWLGHTPRIWGLFMLSGVLLAGCASQAPLPEESYYRLQWPQIAPGTPAVDGRLLLVMRPRTDGLYAERALLYSEDPAHRVLQRYHYHLWLDTPPSLVQDYLIAALRAQRLTGMVADYDPGLDGDFLLASKLQRFEQLVGSDGAEVVVSLELKLERADHGRPLLLREYTETVRAASSAPNDAVAAFEQALQAIVERFVGDAAPLLSAPGHTQQTSGG